MKKEDFKKSIDNINPDAFMGNRLKAKITASTLPVKRSRRVILSAVSFCLALAIIFGAGFMSKTQSPAPKQNTAENTVPKKKQVNAFIMVASAAYSESAEAATQNKILELNEEYSYEIFLRAENIGEDADKENQFTIDLADYLKKHGIDEKNFDTSMMVDSLYKNTIISQYTLNEFKLNLKDADNVKLINVKNTSKYGEMVYNEHKPVFDAPEHGKDITIKGETFDCEKDGFYWEHTIETEKAFYANINTPFSTFNDTITFTVEYTDGSKAIGVVDLVFDESGNATAVCRSYDYVSQ